MKVDGTTTAVAPILSRFDSIIAMCGAILTYIFGEHYILFVAYIGLNIADFLTRWIAARCTQTENSLKASKGLFKKVAYWILIALSFGMTATFMEIGEVIGIDLKVTIMIGWFVLIALIINEIRSIIENLSEIPGVHIPKVLTKGLSFAHKAVEQVTDATIPDVEDKEENTNKEDIKP